MKSVAALDPIVAARLRSLELLIGNTPLLVIRLRYRGEPRVVYAKYEQVNMTGSIKDRMALHIMRQAYLTGQITPGDTIAEATSGNTGIAFSAIGRALGHPVTVFMPDWMSHERMALISSFGASIVPVSREQGGFLGSIRLSEELAARDGHVFLPCQFSNEANADAHMRTTGPEIWYQLRLQGLTPDAFVAGVGTGGTVMGVGRYLRSMNPAVRVYPLEPAESPTISAGQKVGQHRIQGISDEFIPALLKVNEIEPVIEAADGDSIIMAQKLAAVGLAVGISSGSNLIGALKIQDAIGKDAVVATVFSDSNKKYLSTDLMRTEAVKAGYLAPETEVLGFDAMKRVCSLCCDDPACSEHARLEEKRTRA
ncbi:MAG: cysteine synthase family protein [Vicinamibacterales bacterium]|jgi:cysteine synthase A|nr:cysteine synthase family protein [Vicinamibacterales bacterium]